MTEQEIKTIEALNFMGYNDLREISKSELDLSFKALSNKMNPNTTTIEKYKDGNDYIKLVSYYSYLSDIKRTNETIRNILDPSNKTYDYQDEKPEIKQEEPIDNDVKPSIVDSEGRRLPEFSDIQIIDRPRIWIIILSFLLPIYGIIMFIFSRRLTPKASKWYLVFAIIGFVTNFILELYLIKIGFFQ